MTAAESQSAGVFISYRREDVPGQAGRLYDRLSAQFGESHVFMDVDSIGLGLDFLQVLQAALSSCEVMLVLIGPRWMSPPGADGRLDDPRDYVRVEVQTALDRGIRVVPVLVQGASLPPADRLPEPIRPLVRRQAVELGDATFRSDVALLIERLAWAAAGPPAPSRSEPSWRAHCQALGGTRRRLQLTLSESTHTLEYVNRVLRANELRLDGEVIAKSSLLDGVRRDDPCQERYVFPLSDGAEVRTAVVEVQLGDFSIDTVALTVDERSLYRGP